MKTNLIKRPVITEKSLLLANKENVYTFEVAYKANKTQLKQAIQDLFEVDVERVNTIIRPSKRKKTGRYRRLKLEPATKKALVKLAEGQTIELFDIGGES